MGAITQAMARRMRGTRRRRCGPDRAVARVDRRGRGAPPASSSPSGDVIAAASALSPTSIRSCCSSAWSRPSICPRISARGSPAIAAAPGTFRMNVALSELPDSRGACRARAPQPHHGERHHHRRRRLRYMERAYFDAQHRRLVARADRRDADSVDRRFVARAGGHARREPLLPARATRNSAPLQPGARGTMSTSEVADLMIDTDRSRRSQLQASACWAGAHPVAARSRARIRADRRRHLPRRAVARSAVLRAPGARQRATTGCR